MQANSGQEIQGVKAVLSLDLLPEIRQLLEAYLAKLEANHAKDCSEPNR